METLATPKTLEQLREERIARILKSEEEQLRREFPDAPQTLDDIERAAEQMGEQIKREIKREIQHEILDLCGTVYCGKAMACSRGGIARCKSASVRSIVTLHGEEP